jgi:hypothetical protein
MRYAGAPRFDFHLARWTRPAIMFQERADREHYRFAECLVGISKGNGAGPGAITCKAPYVAW